MRGVGYRLNGSLHLFDARTRKYYERAFDYLAGKARRDRGIAHVTAAEVAAAVGCCLRTAERAIRFLLRHGLIARVKRPNRPSAFEVFEARYKGQERPTMPPRWHGRRPRERAKTKVSVPAPPHPPYGNFNTCERHDGRAGPESDAIAGELRQLGIAQPAVVADVSTSRTLGDVALWRDIARHYRPRRPAAFVAAALRRNWRPWRSELAPLGVDRGTSAAGRGLQRAFSPTEGGKESRKPEPSGASGRGDSPTVAAAIARCRAIADAAAAKPRPPRPPKRRRW